jgi:molybdopterin-guanine dinucleotide biosynthesis protein B
MAIGELDGSHLQGGMDMDVLQVVGYKNAGKTTLVCELLRHYNAQGRRAGTIKHDAHAFEPDVPGTDTWRHRRAGAAATAITSPERTAWTMERPSTLDELLSGMERHSLDIVIVEGFKQERHNKIVLLRGEDDAELLRLSHVIAAAVRTPSEEVERLAASLGVPLFVTGEYDWSALLAELPWLSHRTTGTEGS